MFIKAPMQAYHSINQRWISYRAVTQFHFQNVCKTVGSFAFFVCIKIPFWLLSALSNFLVLSRFTQN